MTPLSRRRFLTISASCAAFSARAATVPVANWRGSALGAAASLRLEGLSTSDAAPIVAAVEQEVTRLEDIFSLYRPNSQLCRLNRDGYLVFPAPELLSVFSICTALHTASEGAFDPSIQPLWLALATNATTAEVEAARTLIGWDRVSVAADEIRLPRPGDSALTLNGIAQGAITDRIANLLKSYGLRNVLVDMGEIMALGRHSGGKPWRVGLADADGTIVQRLQLRDRAVATSAAFNAMPGPEPAHILHPNGTMARHKAVSISAPEAAIADGLSTALSLMPREKLDCVLRVFSDAAVEILI